LEPSSPLAKEPSLVRRLIPPISYGVVGIFITMMIARIPHSFSSVLLSSVLILFIVTHIAWLHKVIQPLRHDLKKPDSSPPPKSPQEENHTHDVSIEARFFQQLQERLNVTHQPYVQAQSLQDDKTHLIHANGLVPLLKENHLEVLVQPIVNLPQKRLAFFACIPCIPVGNSMLVKLNTHVDPTNTIPPSPAIDKMVLFQTLQFIRRHHTATPNHAFICPIPSSILKDRHFIEELTDFLYQTRFPFSALIFEVPLVIADPIFHNFSLFKQYGARLVGKWEGKELSPNLTEMTGSSVDFIMLPYSRLLTWLKKKPRRQSLASLRYTIDIAPQIIISQVEKEQDFYGHFPLPFDFGTGNAFGLPKPLHHIQV
jgi:hypothetical protein